MKEESPEQLQILGAGAVIFATLGFLFLGFMGIMPLPSRRGLLIGSHPAWIVFPIGLSLTGIGWFIAGSIMSDQLRKRLVNTANCILVATFLLLAVMIPLMSAVAVICLFVFALLYWVPKACPNSPRGRILLSIAMFLVVLILILALVWLLARFSHWGHQVI